MTKREQLIKLYKKYKGICYLCDKPVRLADATRDHKIPKNLYGHNAFDNLALAHKYCNMLRGTIPIEEFRALLLLGDIEEIQRRNTEVNESIREIETSERRYFELRNSEIGKLK